MLIRDLNRFMCGDAQAYHNELVSKVSRLEEENVRLKKEKVRIFYLSCVLHLVLSHTL